VLVPAAIGVTVPVAEPIIATPGVPLVHVPPVLVSVSVVAVPAQTANVPPIVFGRAFTVTVVTLIQPVDVCVNVINAVAADTPVTIPVAEPTEAAALAVAHVPDTLVSVVVWPTQTAGVPPEAEGNALTVTVAVMVALPQALDIAYVIVVVPAPAPVTTPDESPIVATTVLLLIHVPPVTELDKVVLLPTQTA
jgi:hypothetical protein